MLKLECGYRMVLDAAYSGCRLRLRENQGGIFSSQGAELFENPGLRLPGRLAPRPSNLRGGDILPGRAFFHRPDVDDLAGVDLVLEELGQVAEEHFHELLRGHGRSVRMPE